MGAAVPDRYGFKLDENIPPEGATIFRGAGHDCHTVYQEDLAGAKDSTIASVCRHEQRILVTLDLDFADIRSYPPGSHPGIIILRPRRPDRHQTLRLIIRVAHLLRAQSAGGQLWIVEERRVRIR